MPGDTFEGCVVDGVLGRGGSAVVYRAHDADGPIALKVLADDRRGPTETERLRREFEFADRSRHPHVIDVHRSGPGWLTMEIVDGGTVSARTDVDDTLAALTQVAGALDHTHSRGIVHCDVKPSNILVFVDFSRRGAVLTDFGVAHAVAEPPRQRVQASLPYSAPELLRAQAPSAATDEYALACTAVELLTGAPPFAAETPTGLVFAQLYNEPGTLSARTQWLPPAFDSVIKKAIAKDRDLRYPTCAEFVDRLKDVLGRP